MLDTFYARLRRCGDLACTGRPFTEHRNVPVLTVDPGDPRPAYRQVADTLGEMIRSGQLGAGERLPSVREISEGGVPTASARHALAVTLWLKSWDDNARRPPSHASQAPLATAGDGWHGVVCPYPHLAGAGCPSPHYPAGTAAVTIQICARAILSGDFVTAVRWEWITRNPAASAKPDTRA